MYGPTRTPGVNVAARPDHLDHAPLAHTLKGPQSMTQDPSERGEVHGTSPGPGRVAGPKAMAKGWSSRMDQPTRTRRERDHTALKCGDGNLKSAGVEWHTRDSSRLSYK